MNHIQNRSQLPSRGGPTARSPELLVCILSRYPILESILSFSHRSSISNLAQTCDTLQKILGPTISKLRNPFPRCNKDLKGCTMCHTPVCKDCSEDVTELETPCETMTFYGYEYALLGGCTQQSRQEISLKLQTIVHACRYPEEISQRINRYYFCEVCSHKPRVELGKVVNGDEPEWVLDHYRRYQDPCCLSGRFPRVRWPHVGVQGSPSPCTCTRSGCGASIHLVRVQCLPIHCDLAGFVHYYGDLPEDLIDKLPLKWPHRINRVYHVNGDYDMRSPNARSGVLPFYVKDR